MTRTFTEEEFNALYWKAADGNLISKQALRVVLRTLFPPEPALDPYAALKAAKANGEVIELDPGDLRWRAIKNPDWTLPVDRYRIKPTPKLIPITSDDLPPVVRVKDEDGNTKLVTAIGANGRLEIHNGIGVPEHYHDDGYTWSPDRRTWHSFMKEVEG